MGDSSASLKKGRFSENAILNAKIRREKGREKVRKQKNNKIIKIFVKAVPSRIYLKFIQKPHDLGPPRVLSAGW